MTQQHLHYAQIRTVVEQMGCKGVTQGMRGQGSSNSRLSPIDFDAVPKRLPRHGTASLIGKQAVSLVRPHQLCATLAEKSLQPFQGFLPHGYDSFLAALPYHTQHTLLEIDLITAQLYQFRDPQPCCIG